MFENSFHNAELAWRELKLLLEIFSSSSTPIARQLKVHKNLALYTSLRIRDVFPGPENFFSS
jgi:hypothetical protein